MLKRNVRDYWTKRAPEEREEIRKTVAAADMQSYADEHHLVIFRGKMYSPDSVPCMCDMEAPDQCFEQTIWPSGHEWTSEEKKDKTCYCPCHTYYEPW